MVLHEGLRFGDWHHLNQIFMVIKKWYQVFIVPIVILLWVFILRHALKANTLGFGWQWVN